MANLTSLLATSLLLAKTSLKDLVFMEKNVLNQNKCYLPETIPLCDEMNQYTNKFFNDLKNGIK